MNLIERLEDHHGYAVHDDSDSCATAANALKLARTVAQWHVEDGDECGVIARNLLNMIEAQA